MPRKKSTVKKILKCKRKEIDDCKDHYVVRWKGEWEKAELKGLRTCIDQACAEFLRDLEEPAEPQRQQQPRARFRDEY